MAEHTRRRSTRQGQAAADSEVFDIKSAAPKAAPPQSPSAVSSPSSFFSVPAVVLTGVGLLPPFSVGRRVYVHVSELLGLSREHNSASLLMEALMTAGDGDDAVDGGGGGGGILSHVWAVLKSSAFCGGITTTTTARTAIPYFVAAVVFNHARRTLCFGHGGVGFFVLPQPDEDWRLVLARPDVFLENVVVKAVGGGGVVVYALQKRLWDVLAGGAAAAFLMADDAALEQALVRATHAALHPPPRRRTAVARTLVRRAKDVATTLFLVWLFSCIEFAVAQASATLAVAYAVWALLGKAGGLDAVLRAVFHSSTGSNSGWWPPSTPVSVLLFAWLQLVVYPLSGLLPLVVRAGLMRTVRHRRPGVLLSLAFSAAAMCTVLLYRSRLYIAIETSGLFVFLGYAGISALLLGADWVERRADSTEKKKKKTLEEKKGT